jgi:glycosyltransferase involved in cell wall biosynthesis
MELEIISITPYLGYFGGAQQVMIDVHNGIRKRHRARIIGFEKFKNILPKYEVQRSEYLRFWNPFFLNNKLLIVHGRNIMTLIMIIKRIFFLNTKILYVAHNVYKTHRAYSLFPHNIISVSPQVTQNLLHFFNLRSRNIQMIYNGIIDRKRIPSVRSYFDDGRIVILYPARVNAVKRQLELVEMLSGKLKPQIEIQFAGSGADYDLLVKKCEGSVNFKALGFVNAIDTLVQNADYIMLFSTQEGLPISLIEGLMFGKPLLVNDIGGNFEIGVPGVNAIKLEEDWDKLSITLNDLTSISQKEYEVMSDHSRKRYETFFTYNKMIENYLQVIKKIT